MYKECFCLYPPPPKKIYKLQQMFSFTVENKSINIIIDSNNHAFDYG